MPSESLSLTKNQARNLILRKQGLLSRSDDAEELTRRLVAIQSQYAISVLPALFARCKAINQRTVDRLLQKNRSLIKSWNLRGTVHCYHRADHGLFASTTGVSVLSRMRRQIVTESGATVDLVDCGEKMMEELSIGPRLRSELHELIPDLKELDWAGWGQDVRHLAYGGRLVFAEQGAARTKFARYDLWTGEDAPMPVEGAWPMLLRRYLAGYGPATLADFRYWAGMSRMPASAAVRELGDDIVSIIGPEGQSWMLLASDLADLSDSPIRTCRMLAKFDVLVMGWKDNSLFLDPKYYKQVSRAAGQVEATVLLDGRIVATWRLLRKPNVGAFSVYPFAKLGGVAQERIASEASRLGKAMGFATSEVSFVDA